jgi:4-hydroxy-3-methylbut-2-enyl diphosphate reductase IspH
MAVFIEKSPVTSSICYKTIKTASILIKLVTNVDLTIAFATTCSGSGNQLMNLLVWGRVEKVVTFLTKFLQQKQVLGA